MYNTELLTEFPFFLKRTSSKMNTVMCLKSVTNFNEVAEKYVSTKKVSIKCSNQIILFFFQFVLRASFMAHAYS